MPRKWAPREMRLVSEYLVDQYPRATHLQRVRVGAIHPALHPEVLTAEERRFIGVFRRWADAIVVQDKTLIVVEASIYPDLGDISKLEAYARLVPYTPELEQYRDHEILMELVCCVKDPFVWQLCAEHKISAVIYRPDWIEQYLGELSPGKREGGLTFPLTP